MKLKNMVSYQEDLQTLKGRYGQPPHTSTLPPTVQNSTKLSKLTDTKIIRSIRCLERFYKNIVRTSKM